LANATIAATRVVAKPGGLHDAADDGTISEHVEIVVVPLAG
jgi:hypothetical protein